MRYARLRAHGRYSPTLSVGNALPLRRIAALAVVAALTASGQGNAAGSAESARSPSAAITDPVRNVIVIHRADIEMLGLTSLEDLLSHRSRFNSFGLGRPYVLGSNNAGFLINGRRVSDSVSILSTIPLSVSSASRSCTTTLPPCTAETP